MGFVIAIVVGGITGWVASMIMKTNAQMGIVANVLVGIVGSALGRWIAPKLGLATEGGIGTWLLVSVGGAVLLILILKVLGVFK